MLKTLFDSQFLGRITIPAIKPKISRIFVQIFLKGMSDAIKHECGIALLRLKNRSNTT